MRQARDLLYRKVHLGSNPNPGASPARFSSGISHQLFHSLVTGQPRQTRIKASLAPSSICGKYFIDCYATDYNSDGNPYKMNRIQSE